MLTLCSFCNDSWSLPADMAVTNTISPCVCISPSPDLCSTSPFLSLVRVASHANDCSSHRPGEWDCPNRFGPVRTYCWSWGEDHKWNPTVPRRRRRREWPLVRQQIVSECLLRCFYLFPHGQHSPEWSVNPALSRDVNRWYAVKKSTFFWSISLGSVWWSIVLSQIYSTY